MYDLDRLGWEILNATADDCENLEQIYVQLANERQASSGDTDRSTAHDAPLLSDVAGRLRALVEADLLEVEMDEAGHTWENRSDLSYVWRGWFRMTPRGRSMWESMESTFCPVEQSSAE